MGMFLFLNCLDCFVFQCFDDFCLLLALASLKLFTGLMLFLLLVSNDAS